MLKKTSVYIGTLILGIVLYLLSFIFMGSDLKAISDILIGAGASLFVISTVNLFTKYFEQRNPAVTKQSRTEYKDERSSSMRYKAKAKAGDMIQWLVLGIACLLIVIDASLWVIMVTLGVFLLYSILNRVFYE
ncbi:hypothetical protein SAMN05661091_0051 [Paenibacillus uliginis N3/975]|uniref:Uncharacterized protein n=1 Tax=Paenibacillus uliginis N3/975 TaxID=1313296 RepID=A0A1X7G6H0_9BACL|nr:hypothetical protein [Paenibacillus uliginis]SMF64275.1 hypothetical protein SAMN05661091_0051 [Paenibacillus uliginis N3/975]